MKFLLVLGFCLSANAGLPQLAARQLPSPGAKGPAQQPSAIKELKPVYFPNAIRKQFLWGPMTLQAANGTHKGSGLDSGADAFTKPIDGICKNCMLLKADYDLADKAGKRLDLKDGVYLHHIIMADSAGRMGGGGGGVAPKCEGTSGLASLVGSLFGPKGSTPAPGKSNAATRRAAVIQAADGPSQNRPGLGLGAIWIAKGHENDAILYAAPNSTVKSGIWIPEHNGIVANIEAINYRNVPQEVYLSIDAEYLQMEGPRPNDYLYVGLGMMTNAGCTGKLALDVPKDRAITFTSNDYEARGDGYILNISPHLHDGAVDLQIRVNGNVACKSQAVYGEDGQAVVDGKTWETISSYTPCREPIKLKKGDILTLSSEYDLTKHRLRPRSKDQGMEAEAMAIAFYRFASS